MRLGYTEHPGQQDVERFMKHYFLIAKDVGDLTAILCAELEDSHAKSVPVLSRVMAKLRPVKRKKLAESDDFIVDKNRITVANASAFKRDPVNLIRIFHLAQKHNLAFHPDAMRAIDALAQTRSTPSCATTRKPTNCSWKSSPPRTTRKPCCGG